MQELLDKPNPKDILGFIPPKNVLGKKSKLAINNKPEIFQEILNYLLNIELELKPSKIDNQSLYLQSSLRKSLQFYLDKITNFTKKKKPCWDIRKQNQNTITIRRINVKNQTLRNNVYLKAHINRRRNCSTNR